MAYEPLHHKYRPQTFSDLVGQVAISTTLINAIKLAKIAPAYLFTGPRGTGKTSSARILAKSLNCLSSNQPTPEPCGECDVCQTIASGTALDVIEIDAASNTGVDNIREIIERSRFAPVQSRYKVYAIDECHMLSTAAFNALLKTLEEPPPQVVFILATTDPQRVLPTIISRCQRFDYRRIQIASMVEHLQFIAKQEKINITTEALSLNAQIANGGLRDAESLLDQLSLLPHQITVNDIWELVGAVPEQDLFKLLVAIREQNIEEILTQCRHLLDRGKEPIVILQSLASFYLNLLTAKTTPRRQDLVAITETCWQQLLTESEHWQLTTILQGQQQLKNAETQIKHSTQPRLWLEVSLLGLIDTEPVNTTPTKPKNHKHISQSPKLSLIKSQQTSPQSQTKSTPISQPSKTSTSTSDTQFAPTVDHQNQESNLQPKIASSNNLATKPELTSTQTQDNLPPATTLELTSQPTSSQATSPAKTTASSTFVDLSKKNHQPSPELSNSEVASPKQAPPNYLAQQAYPISSQSSQQNQQVNSVELKSVEPKITETAIAENFSARDRTEIWQQVIDCVQPRMTKTLMSKHCHLIELTNSLATVGIVSVPLQKMSQSKIPNMEAAFVKVCDRKIKVVLEVSQLNLSNSEQTHVNTRKNNPQSTLNERTTQTSPQKLSSSPTISETNNTQTPPKQHRETTPTNSIQSQLEIAPVQNPLPTPKTSLSENRDNLTESKVNNPSQKQEENSSKAQDKDKPTDSEDFSKAVELVAKRFEGEVIELDGSFPLPSSKTSELEAATDRVEPSEQQQLANEAITSEAVNTECVATKPISSEEPLVNQQASTTKEIASAPPFNSQTKIIIKREATSSYDFDDEDIPF